MKPHYSNRNRAYYRHHRNRVINRKRKIAKQIRWHVLHQQYGRLNKGKIHCSCQMCSDKTRLLGHKHSDKIKMLSLLSQIHNYYN